MAVTSKPMSDRKDSAVVSRARLRRQRGAIERWTAWTVLLVSFLGSIAALHGGWPPLIASLITLQPNWAALLGGLGIQVLLTFLEWHYFDQPLVAWPARVIDAATTALGYGPLILAPLSAALASQALPQGDIAAWCIIAVISFLIAWYPENRLVE